MSTGQQSESAVDYLQRHRIAHGLEGAVTELLSSRPSNPSSALAAHFQSLSASPGSVSLPPKSRDVEIEKLRESYEDLKKQLAQKCDELARVQSSGVAAPVDLSNPLVSIVMDTDSYKLSHWLQYPPKTTSMFSYFESRGGAYPGTIFFGLQYYIKRFLLRPITQRDVDEANTFARGHGLPFNSHGWTLIVERHGGRLPIRMRAVPEGTWVPVSNILLSIESLDPDCFWLVSWLETMLVRLWCPVTIATNSFELKRLISHALDETSDPDDRDAGTKMHDFGARGVSSQETAMIAGASHLTSFEGSDTIVGVWACNQYYNHDMAAKSIPASEHSTMTMWGREREKDAYMNMIRAYGDCPVFAIVSDSYDVFNAVDNLFGQELKDEVVSMSAQLVVRPDSGDPVEVCLKIANLLEGRFGCTTNSMGFKVLNSVRIIQGDGVNAKVVAKVLAAFKEHNFAASNIGFGSGGGLLQKFHRDTCKFAFKCSFAVVDGNAVEVYKDPITDPGKQSKRGRLDLVRGADGNLTTAVIPQGQRQLPNSELEDVYENGLMLKVRVVVWREVVVVAVAVHVVCCWEMGDGMSSRCLALCMRPIWTRCDDEWQRL